MNEIDGREHKAAKVLTYPQPDFTAYWKQLRLVPVIRCLFPIAQQWVATSYPPCELEYKAEEYRFYIKGIGPTPYFYDEGYLWKQR